MNVERLVVEFLDMSKAMKFENIYNEFSLQHELGIFLRERITKEYKVEFERNVRFFLSDENVSKLVKKEIDIVIYDEHKKEKIAIELKHPLNGQYPEQMFSFIKDIKFLEGLIDAGFSKCLSLVLVKDRLFYEGSKIDGIYKYFRGGETITGSFNNPTGRLKSSMEIIKKYKVEWKPLDEEYSYYIINFHNIL